MSKKDITLNQFGFSFQMKTITLLLTDVNFFQQIYDILEDDYFDSEANEWIGKNIKEYFEKYFPKQDPRNFLYCSWYFNR